LFKKEKKGADMKKEKNFEAEHTCATRLLWEETIIIK